MAIKRFLPVFAVVTITSAALFYANVFIKRDTVLPVYTAADLNPELVPPGQQGSMAPHFISSFSLTDHQGNAFSDKDLKGKIYVADFFFTTCPSICPKMATQMQRIFRKYKDHPRLSLVSHTVMPEVDSVPVLREYAARYQAVNSNWSFLTGNKRDIYHIARTSYFAVTTTGDGGEDDFIHTENFILVDSKKQIRGFYDGTSAGEVDKLLKDIELLLEEEVLFQGNQ